MGDEATMMDLDAIEFCDVPNCRQPLVLIELVRDVGGPRNKPVSVLARLANSCEYDIVALCVYYTVDEASACACGPEEGVSADCTHGIVMFHVRHVRPHAGGEYVAMSPSEYGDMLRRYRDRHHYGKSADAAALGRGSLHRKP
jgi:hypothetical protein